MKFIDELFNAILLRAEQAEDDIESDTLEISGYDSKQIAYHCKRALNEEYIEGVPEDDRDGYKVTITDLRIKGHHHLEDLRRRHVL